MQIEIDIKFFCILSDSELGIFVNVCQLYATSDNNRILDLFVLHLRSVDRAVCIHLGAIYLSLKDSDNIMARFYAGILKQKQTVVEVMCLITNDTQNQYPYFCNCQAL